MVTVTGWGVVPTYTILLIQYIDFHITHTRLPILLHQMKYQISFNVILCLTIDFYSASNKQILHNTYSNFCKASIICWTPHVVQSIDAQISFLSQQNPSKCSNSALAAEQIKHQSALESQMGIWGGLGPPSQISLFKGQQVVFIIPSIRPPM